MSESLFEEPLGIFSLTSSTQILAGLNEPLIRCLKLMEDVTQVMFMSDVALISKRHLK